MSMVILGILETTLGIFHGDLIHAGRLMVGSGELFALRASVSADKTFGKVQPPQSLFSHITTEVLTVQPVLATQKLYGQKNACRFRRR